MRAEEAIRHVNDLVFWPEWTILARPVMAPWGRDPDEIEITLGTRTVDTDREYAREGYRKPRYIETPVKLDVRDLDPDDVDRFILECAAKIHEHEDREALRRRSEDFDAPFHPHRVEGMMRWESARRGRRLAERYG
jgi:hypothetical protein